MFDDLELYGEQKQAAGSIDCVVAVGAVGDVPFIAYRNEDDAFAHQGGVHVTLRRLALFAFLSTALFLPCCFVTSVVVIFDLKILDEKTMERMRCDVVEIERDTKEF